MRCKAVARQKGDNGDMGGERSQYFMLGKASWLFASTAAVGTVNNKEQCYCLLCWQENMFCWELWHLSCSGGCRSQQWSQQRRQYQGEEHAGVAHDKIRRGMPSNITAGRNKTYMSKGKWREEMANREMHLWFQSSVRVPAYRDTSCEATTAKVRGWMAEFWLIMRDEGSL